MPDAESVADFFSSRATDCTQLIVCFHHTFTISICCRNALRRLAFISAGKMCPDALKMLAFGCALHGWPIEVPFFKRAVA